MGEMCKSVVHLKLLTVIDNKNKVSHFEHKFLSAIKHRNPKYDRNVSRCLTEATQPAITEKYR